MNELTELRDALRRFSDERDWHRFHTPENLAKSVVIEAAELLECFQWSPEYDRHAVADEIADVMMYLIVLADRLDLDLRTEVLRKMKENALRYPPKPENVASEATGSEAEGAILSATNGQEE